GRAAAAASPAAGEGQGGGADAGQLGRAGNAGAAPAEGTAAQGRAYAPQGDKDAPPQLRGGEMLEGRGGGGPGHAQAGRNQISAYEAGGNVKAAEQYSAQHGAEYDALSKAAQADLYNANIDLDAYTALQKWVAKFTQIADQETSHARQAREAAQQATARAS